MNVNALVHDFYLPFLAVAFTTLVGTILGSTLIGLTVGIAFLIGAELLSRW